MPQLDYRPAGSLLPLFLDREAFWYVTLGPLGSGKTLASIMKLMQLAGTQKAGRDGIRRTRGVISRPTLPQIKSTVLRDIMDPGTLGPVARWRPSDNLIVIDVGDIHAEWFLLPLETAADQRRVLSMQLSYAYLNEVREIDFEIVTAIAGRVGRYPRQVDGGVTQPAVLMDSNPPASGSALHLFLTEPVETTGPDGVTRLLGPDGHPLKGPRRNLRYIHQPSGLSEDADWLEYLPGGALYYRNLEVGQSLDWIDVHVHGRFGRDVSGLSVFGTTFDEGWHTGRDLKTAPGQPLMVGLDPGLNPAAVIGQPLPNGTVQVLAEVYAENMLFRRFLEERLRPVLNEARFQMRPFVVVMDPAGASRTAMSADTPLGVARELGLPVRLAPTNDIQARIIAVERWLTSSVGRQPSLLIDPDRCPVLVDALARSYRYRRSKVTRELEAQPEKRHPISDVADALQYLCLGLSGRTERRERAGRERPWERGTGQAAPSALAWT